MNFKSWQDSKKVKETDLQFTKALSEALHIDIFKQLSEQMALLQPSFSEGLGFLEIATDLILMGHKEDLFIGSLDFKTWSESIKKLRYPQSTLRDNLTQITFEKLPWPQGAKLKYERRGDKFGVELKYFISNQADLLKLITALERVQKEIA